MFCVTITINPSREQAIFGTWLPNFRRQNVNAVMIFHTEFILWIDSGIDP